MKNNNLLVIEENNKEILDIFKKKIVEVYEKERKRKLKFLRTYISDFLEKKLNKKMSKEIKKINIYSNLEGSKIKYSQDDVYFCYPNYIELRDHLNQLWIFRIYNSKKIELSHYYFLRNDIMITHQRNESSFIWIDSNLRKNIDYILNSRSGHGGIFSYAERDEKILLSNFNDDKDLYDLLNLSMDMNTDCFNVDSVRMKLN